MPPDDSLLLAAPLVVAAIVMAVRFVGCGIDADPLPGTWDGNGDGDGGKPVKVTAEFAGNGVLSATAGFPDNKPDTMEYDGFGTYAYSIPYWCDTIDIVLLGAGGGGMYAEFNIGTGGAAGDWNAVSLQRGSGIPWETTTINFTVGQGGAGGTLGVPQGGPGGDTSASWDTATGTTTKTASGGAPAVSSDVTGAGPSPISTSTGAATLNAGAAQPTEGAIGNPPGGGGAGGGGLRQGGAGADGGAIVVASQLPS